MNLSALLRAQAELVEREYRDHDPTAFTRRLAERIAAEDAEEQPLAPGARPFLARGPLRGDRPPSAGASASAGPAPGPPPGPWAARGAGPGGREVRETARRAGARCSEDGRAELRRDLLHLCGGVAAAADLDELALGLDRPGQKAATRTLGCLLYSMGRTADAVFWWRIAAQGGDHLAVHCLAVHYTSEGQDEDAELWRGHARDLAAPQRLPEVALGPARPLDPADIARTLTEEFDGEIVLTLREAVARAAVPSSPATAARPVRAAAVPPQRRPLTRVR
ncbi:hypothetical protein ACWEQL_15640 [Kitasatospora sp. NPDC004240]